jgi:phosphoribosylformylglycinamidine cyclo-ligase
MAHITGGGLTENIPRILPPGCAVRIDRGTWPVLPIFTTLQKLGGVPDDEMFRAFNMGIGLVIVCRFEDESEVVRLLSAAGEREVWTIGRVEPGRPAVRYAES